MIRFKYIINIFRNDMFEKNYCVYMISCRDPSINATYIGQTGNFKKRYYQHNYFSSKEQYEGHNYLLYRFIREFGGFDNFKMTPIIESLTQEEAKFKEGQLIKQLKPYLNVVSPHRTIKEYYEDNKEQIRLYHANLLYLQRDKMKARWTKNNQRYREKNNKQMKIHYKKNRDRILADAKIKWKCICGSVMNYRHRSQHFKTACHTNGLKNFCKEVKEAKKEILRL